jgi:hypothetical protein
MPLGPWLISIGCSPTGIDRPTAAPVVRSTPVTESSTELTTQATSPSSAIPSAWRRRSALRRA